jgi:hypothetical protein
MLPRKLACSCACSQLEELSEIREWSAKDEQRPSTEEVDE